MAKKTKEFQNESITIPDIGLADIEMEAEASSRAADRARAAEKEKQAAAKAAVKSCANCRTPDWRNAAGTYCRKRRIELDPSVPIMDCKFWRKPLRL